MVRTAIFFALVIAFLNSNLVYGIFKTSHEKLIDYTCGFIPVYQDGSLVAFINLYCNAQGTVVRTDVRYVNQE